MNNTDPTGYFTLQEAVTTVSMVGILASVGSSAGYVGYEYVTSDGISGDEALVMLDQWMAGYAHGVSGGITTAVRREDYGEIQEGDHAFLWNMGNLAGVSTSFILGFQLPMAMAGQIGGAKWATTFAGGLAGVSEAYGAYEAGKGLTDGVWEYSDVFNLLSLVPYAVPVVAGVGKTLGTLRRNAKVADDVGGALSQVDNVLDDVGETRTAVDLQGTGACFVAGTEILTPEGAVDIEDIEVGDWVIADDPTTPGEIEKRQVLQTFVKETDTLIHLYIDGEVISTTEEHPFWVSDQGWVEAGDLEAGMLLQTDEETFVDIDRIEEEEGEFEVYNFEVEDFRTYFVSDLEILVHNACGPNSAPNPALEGNPYHPQNVEDRIRPPYRANPAHDTSSPLFNPKKTPEPGDAEKVYKNAIRGDMGTWYGIGEDGSIYRFFSDNAGGTHFSGKITPSQLPNDVRKQLGLKGKQK